MGRKNQFCKHAIFFTVRATGCIDKSLEDVWRVKGVQYKEQFNNIGKRRLETTVVA